MIKPLFNINEALNFICKTYCTTIYTEDSLEGQKNFINNYVYGNETIKLFNKEEKYYGYSIEHELVGIISLRNNGYIKFLFVDKNYQKMGIGKKLLKFVTDLAIKEKISCLTLDSSLSNVLFYEKLGFIKISEKICVDDICFIPMQKILS